MNDSLLYICLIIGAIAGVCMITEKINFHNNYDVKTVEVYGITSDGLVSLGTVDVATRKSQQKYISPDYGYNINEEKKKDRQPYLSPIKTAEDKAQEQEDLARINKAYELRMARGK
jgi:hypothetical protein